MSLKVKIEGEEQTKTEGDMLNKIGVKEDDKEKTRKRLHQRKDKRVESLGADNVT